MEIEYSDKIKFEKVLNKLDKFVIDFTRILNELKIDYVLVSEYVSILFGRNRSSEDIDLIIEKIDFGRFKELWGRLYEKFECLNTDNISEAYNEYLLNNISIRFAVKTIYVPNMEVKFPHIELNDLDMVSLREKKEVVLNSNTFYISPIELQIAFKVFLGSKKDIEDALFLYKLFKNQLNMELIKEFGRKLKIIGLLDRYIR